MPYQLVSYFQPIYEAIVTEDVPIGSFVVRVSASDADEAGTRNARIHYEIVDDKDLFVMHRKSGKVLRTVYYHDYTNHSDLTGLSMVHLIEDK